MEELYKQFLEAVDRESLMRNTEELTRLELGQTWKSMHGAAQHAAELLRQAGIPQVEVLSFPADGKTVYQDKRMPLAWEASIGKLTLLKTGAPQGDPWAGYNPLPNGDFVAADYQRHPFHLIKGSTATPPGGTTVRIITESQFLAGENPKNSLVMLNALTPPRAAALCPILDQGAIGLISDYLTGRYESPDSIQWVAACTEGSNWHVQCEDRPFIGFSVSPKAGDFIRQKAASGALLAHMECDGRRYEDTLPLVTALLPGRRPQEVWLLAHLYEPLADDDSCGVAASLETMRLIKQFGKTEFSIRVIYAMELYGFAAYAASRGTNLAGQVIGACNYDSIACSQDCALVLNLAGPASPFYGNALTELLYAKLKNQPGAPRFEFNRKNKMYFDDQFMSDPSIGIPTLWPLKKATGFWHNSCQSIDMLDRETFAASTAFDTTLIKMIADPNPQWLPAALELSCRHLEEDKEELQKSSYSAPAEALRHLWMIEQNCLQDFSHFTDYAPLEKAQQKLEAAFQRLVAEMPNSLPQSPWRNYADQFIVRRKETGFPHDLVKIPKADRISLPNGVLYGAFANILSNLDGEKSLGEVFREAEYERGILFSETEVKKNVDAICYLADYGYLELVKSASLDQETIVSALHMLGVKRGDLLMIHSSLSGCGHIQGGAGALIQAIQTALGSDGTALFPTFTRPYIYLGDSLNKAYNYRPFDAADPEQVWTGSVPKTLLRQNAQGLLRSRHITHSWAGFGPLAKACLQEQTACEAPSGASSPMGKALQHSGKILYIGCPIAATTFLHFLEDHCELPFLDSAVCRCKNPDGSLKTVLLEKHLPGHRDFYRGNNAEQCKFFQRASEAGLEIRKTALGTGFLQLIDMQQLFEIGKELITNDPRILLCDDPACAFCSRF